MSRGYQVDPIAEHTAATELAAAWQSWTDAENEARHAAQRALDSGARAHVVAEGLGMSRSTFYRWMASDYR